MNSTLHSYADRGEIVIAEQPIKPERNSQSESYAGMSSNREDRAAVGLMKDVANGSELALRRVYREFGGLVFSIAFRSLKDGREAEEVAQDVFVKVWRLAGTFDPERCSASGWIAMMTRSACIDRIRKRSSRPELEYTDFPSEEHVERSREGGFAAPKAPLSEELAGLEEQYRRPVELAFYEGCTHREIAERLNITLGSAKHLLYRGLAALKERYHSQ